ncbi:MAG: hypothetical protein NC548_54390 [Lachnospiraceae bacterium]|nr:hypothetical protein [Lachnospiraceae bacterium]
MKEKLTTVIQDMEYHIKREQEPIDRCTEDIREYTKTCTPENMVMFLPGKIRELEEAISRRQKYVEQLNMLQFIQKEN